MTARNIILTLGLLAVAWGTAGTASGQPAGGFVTGGGWIDSPAGAYIADTALAGQASFGFVSAYQKGANVPTGSTEFQFQAGALNFRSASYLWLVITPDRAQFKGSGTINGESLAPNGTDYLFMVWAEDDEPDTFRIKIWYEDGSDVVIYDNAPGQAIGGGSIVIHSR